MVEDVVQEQRGSLLWIQALEQRQRVGHVRVLGGIIEDYDVAREAFSGASFSRAWAVLWIRSAGAVEHLNFDRWPRD